VDSPFIDPDGAKEGTVTGRPMFKKRVSVDSQIPFPAAASWNFSLNPSPTSSLFIVDLFFLPGFYLNDKATIKTSTARS
jgi:hypothetical protein